MTVAQVLTWLLVVAGTYVVCVCYWLALAGLGVLVPLYAIGIVAVRVDAPRPWRSALRGGPVLAPTFLVPFFGWFILLPWVLVSGVGATVLTLAERPAS
jgi:hypothetical protein